MKISILIFISKFRHLKEELEDTIFTLVKEQSRLYVRKFSLSQRTINVWNSLSADCVNASVYMVKNRIDKYLIRMVTYRKVRIVDS